MSERRFRVDLDQHRPNTALPIDPEFADMHAVAVREGVKIAAGSRVMFVGMARQIAGVLPATINRIEALGARFKKWSAVVVENDSTDGTKDILREWAAKRPENPVIVDCRDLGREKLSGFEPARVTRYAEYRTRYRDLAWGMERPDYVIALDLDPWGGWDDDGVMSSLAWLSRLPNAAGMASTSLYEGTLGDGSSKWLHYDIWALRIWGWAPRWDGYLPFWLPPPGAPPVPVRSAFGALVVYKPTPFFACTPTSIDGDIEHVGLHREMQERLGMGMYLNPASRTVMHWKPEQVLPTQEELDDLLGKPEGTT